MRWQILCDFDGTISPTDTLASLLGDFAPPEWREIDRAMTMGQFGSREARERQTGLLSASLADVNNHLDRIELDPGFKGFVVETTRLGLPLTIVSDGYDHAIRRVFTNHKIEHLDIVCNRLLFLEDNKLGVEFPFADKDCAMDAGACKCSAMGRLRNRKSVLIGDGYSDFCTAGAADFVFARNELATHCRQEGIPFFEFEHFEQLTPLLGKVSGDGAELLALAGASHDPAL